MWTSVMLICNNQKSAEKIQIDMTAFPYSTIYCKTHLQIGRSLIQA